MNLLKKAASGEGAYFERYLRLEVKYEGQNKASEQLVKKHKTLQKKVDKLEWVAQVLSTVDVGDRRQRRRHCIPKASVQRRRAGPDDGREVRR